jgi:hypothetical protein
MSSLRGNEQDQQKPKTAPLPFLQGTPDQGQDGNIETHDPNPRQDVVELSMARPGRVAIVTGEGIQITQHLRNTRNADQAGGVLQVHGRKISLKVRLTNI